MNLFIEFYDINKTKEVKDEEKKHINDYLAPEGLPDLFNEFYGKFTEPNNFFDSNEDEEKK